MVWFSASSGSPRRRRARRVRTTGFILFTSDRATPATSEYVRNCEDIYVMSPDGIQPYPPYTRWRGRRRSARLQQRRRRLVAQQEADRVPEQSDQTCVPQIFLMNLDGSEPQLLVSLPRGGAFPSFSHNGNELCFHSQTMPRRDIYIVNVHGTGLTNLTSPAQLPGQLGVAGDNLRCDWSPKSNAHRVREQPARPCWNAAGQPERRDLRDESRTDPTSSG